MATHPDKFSDRHLGPNAQEIQDMLQAIGVASLDELIYQTVPDNIRTPALSGIPAALTEQEYLRALKQVAAKNKVFRSYIGLGYYGTHTPGVILRNIFENPGWYTQYTPYQAEIAQGRLEALLNFQTMVTDLTGLPVANASLLDEATAAAEAMNMGHAIKSKAGQERNRFLVANDVFPQTIDVLITRAEPLGIHVDVQAADDFNFTDDVFGILLQYPGQHGQARDYSELVAKAKANDVFVVVAADLLSLALLTAPGQWGADVVVGNTQRFGVPMGFGGPHAAFFATHEEYIRQAPGRIIGVSIDRFGNPALRMALQTREQHIKRDKATSNICTAQALLAIMASMYAVYHGPKGIRDIALFTHKQACRAAAGIKAAGFSLSFNDFFDTIQVQTSGAAETQAIRSKAEQLGINFRYVNEQLINIAFDETVTDQDLTDIITAFASAKNQTAQLNPSPAQLNIPSNLYREMDYLTHDVFNKHHSESQMLRYIKRLESKDLSLAHSMISLGSCTMKLNATSEMIPVSWPEFGAIHPFVPSDQVQGYYQIFNELEQWLCRVTGFDACSLQPNSGAQGEYTGLLTIRAYHMARGEQHRNIALIPSSAHGTNPASAVMAGMKVIVTKCDENGNIDVADLREKAELHAANLSCLMVTYPSTHGVFEAAIKDICDITHQNGGLVYMDGANMNAQVGLTSPAAIGADVCHLNLHKTFAIPHGGGGPGMGPICVNNKLAPYLPGHVLAQTGGEQHIRAVSATPWGSASILLISYGYIRMLGPVGLTDATIYAIFNANYIKSRLEKAYKTLYSGAMGRVAHELIIDLRDYKKAGIEAEDVAKRLIDYGFHAPTLSFPVPGTIMIEPTESEDKAELDRFCEALLSIRQEIEEVLSGAVDAHDNVLKNAPHPIHEITNDTWTHPYSRAKAAWPLPFVYAHKFWPAVARVNNTHGDRNLVCTCIPTSEYA